MSLWICNDGVSRPAAQSVQWWKSDAPFGVYFFVVDWNIVTPDWNGQEGLWIYRISSTILCDCLEPPDRFWLMRFFYGMWQRTGDCFLFVFPTTTLKLSKKKWVPCACPRPAVITKGKQQAYLICGECGHFYLVCLCVMLRVRQRC